MLIVQSRWACRKCKISYLYAKDKLEQGSEPVEGGYRVFFKCPKCGEEIEDVIAEQGLNPLCLTCENIGNTCAGTTNPVWTGCVKRRIIE